MTTTARFYVEQVRNVTVICFTAHELSETNYEAVADELFELVPIMTQLRPVQIVCEMSSVRRVDDLGLAMLHALHGSIQEVNGKIVFCRLSSQVQTAIFEAGLSKEFDIRLTRGEAVWSF